MVKSHLVTVVDSIQFPKRPAWFGIETMSMAESAETLLHIYLFVCNNCGYEYRCQDL